MADAKLSALTELDAAPAVGDEIYIRDVSESAADESKRITIANLILAVAISAINNATENELVSVGATVTELEAESTLTYDGTTLTLGSGQINFPDSQNASADANTLDDYEEGTFTPTIMDNSLDGSGESQGYGTRVGRYTKIGNRVFFSLYLVTSSLGSLTTGQKVKIGGLPFAVNSTANNLQAFTTGGSTNLALGTAGYYPIAEADVTGVSYFSLSLTDVTDGVSGFLLSEWSSDGQMRVAGQYET